MIMNGRYAVLYGKLDPAIQQEILARMAGLIEEERDYEDKGNYGHFCNILPTIAIDDVLQRNGKSPEEAFELISTHMWAALNPEGFRKLSRLPFFLSFSMLVRISSTSFPLSSASPSGISGRSGKRPGSCSGVKRVGTSSYTYGVSYQME